MNEHHLYEQCLFLKNTTSRCKKGATFSHSISYLPSSSHEATPSHMHTSVSGPSPTCFDNFQIFSILSSLLYRMHERTREYLMTKLAFQGSLTGFIGGYDTDLPPPPTPPPPPPPPRMVLGKSRTRNRSITRSGLINRHIN